jgi:hypothetical protein
MALSDLEQPLKSLGLNHDDKEHSAGRDDSKTADMGSIRATDESAADSKNGGSAEGSPGVIADFVTMGMFIIGEYGVQRIG